jgi:hypothetical protein
VSSVTMGPPTLAGFTDFLQNFVGIPAAVVTASATSIAWAFQISMDIVNQALNAVPDTYRLAVYNLGADNLINFASDPTTVVGFTTYFSDLRKQFGVGKFYAGVIASAGDNGTSESLTVPEAFRNLTIANLRNLKTPYGQNYLALAQSYGPSIWGLS